MHDANEVYYYAKLSGIIILHGGHRYHKNKQYKSGTVTWRCSHGRRKKCPGTLSVVNDYTIVKRRAHSDNCLPNFEDNEELLLIGKAQAAIRMRAQLNDISEEEYVDDPIKLFDFEQERVQFGTQPLQCSYTGTTPHQSEDSAFIENIELSETDGTDINIEHFSASDCRPLSVKLVDCGKYPWYYKKYSQQILNKLNIFNLVSNDDSEEDINSENSDCIVVEDIIDHLDQKIKDFSSNILPEIICKTWLEKRQERMKLKEDIEIQIALSLKNTSEIDLKRNKGLIGIKITQKPVIDNDVNIEINKKDKHTKITTTPKDETSKNDEEIKNKKTEADDVVKNLTVQFNLGEMSEKLLEKIISKKNSVQSCENKPKTNKFNKNNDKKKSAPKKNTCKSSSLPNKVKDTVRVKETPNTNHVKTNEKILLPHTNENEKQKVEQQIDLNKKSPKKHVEDKGEPNSPILPCSSTSNLAKKKLADNLVTKKNLYKMQNADNKICQLGENVETYTKPFINDKCKGNDLKMNNDTQKLDQPNINRVVQSSVDRGVSVTFGGTSNDTRTTYKYAPSISAVRPQFKPSIATNDCSKIAAFTNGLNPNETSLDSNNSNNNTAQSSYGSAIILRPMIPVRAQSNHHILKMQPRFYQNPYTANSHRPPFWIPDHRLNLRSANVSTPNYRFPTPQQIGCPYQYYSHGVQPGHNSGYQHNLPHWLQKGSEQHKTYPYPPRPVLQSSLNTKSVSDPQSSDIPQSNSIIQLHNNNIDLAKKKISDPRMLELDSLDSDLIVSKTKMLAVLDSATKKLEIDIAEKYFTERAQELVNKHKIPNVASKLDLTNIDDYRKLMELQKKYSKDPITNSELVAKRGKILESISNNLKRGIDAKNTHGKVQESVNKFKRPKLNKEEQANEDNRKNIKQAGGYSPPILPIPTFQNVLHRVKMDVQKQDKHITKKSSVINVKEINPNGKTMQTNTPRGPSTCRKISIEEYKNRALQMNQNQFKNSNINVCRKGNDKNNPNLQIKRMYNVDRCSTETDLGYDSDSTVIL